MDFPAGNVADYVLECTFPLYPKYCQNGISINKKNEKEKHCKSQENFHIAGTIPCVQWLYHVIPIPGFASGLPLPPKKKIIFSNSNHSVT